MKRTVSIPISLPPERFLPLMCACADIFNAHVDWALTEKTYNKNKAHHALYETLRGAYPDVPSALVQSVRDTAMEAVKATKFERQPRKKPTSGLRYDQRTMTLRGEQLTLSCPGKRERVILHVPEYFREVSATWRCKAATLTYTRKTKQFWIHLVFEAPTPALVEAGITQGLDRGLHHLVSTSDGQFFSGNTIRASQRRYLHNRRTLQAKGTPSSRRRLKAMAGREQRFSKQVNHVIAKTLVAQSDVSTFVLEDLSGIRNQRRGKRMNKWLGSWPFYQFELFLSYKAEAVGKSVVFVDARYTSRKCSQCGYIAKSNRCKSRFCCTRCRYTIHADTNAAVNVRDNHFLSLAREASREQAVVNPPHATNSVQLQAIRPCAGGS